MNPTDDDLVNAALGLLGEEAKFKPKSQAVEEEPEEPIDYFDTGEVNVDKVYTKLFSEVYGYLPPSGIDHLTTQYPEDFWPEDVRYAIPEVSDYILPEEATEIFVVGIDNNEPGSMTGPPGTGKSDLARQIAARRQQPFVRISGKDGLELSSLIGEMSVVKDDTGATITEWKDGVLPQAVKMGALLCVDEITKISPQVNMAFQWLLEEGGKLFLEDKPGTVEDKLVIPHPEFRIVTTDNVKGLGDGLEQFSATNVQDISMINRIGWHITTDYLPQDTEIAILTGKYKLNPELAKDMTSVAKMIRTGHDEGKCALSMSVRTLMFWAKWSVVYKDPKRGLDIAFKGALSDDADKSFVENTYRVVFDDTKVYKSRSADAPF